MVLACIEVSLYFGCLKLMWKLLQRFTTLVRPDDCPFLCEGAVLHGDNHIASWRQNATLNESKPVAMAVFPPCPHLYPCAQWEEDPMVAPHSESGTPPSRLCPPPPSPHTPPEAWMALPSHAPHDHPPATKPMEQKSVITDTDWITVFSWPSLTSFRKEKGSPSESAPSTTNWIEREDSQPWKAGPPHARIVPPQLDVV